MEDITPQMLEFKEAMRHVWNTNFAKTDAPMSPEIQEAFRSVELGLFSAIVLAPLGMSERATEYRRHPLPFIVVRPAQFLQELPLQVFEQQAGGNNSVGGAITVAVDDQSAFDFFDFFDWYSYGHVDFPYIRARVSSLHTQRKLQGSLVLIEQVHCRFAMQSQRSG